ncbi:MAG TPA: hypothetical protein DEQ02_10595 [Ruminococcaceae bacterium]|nr:hypothetical protein [Oscillospiraceae bacterium]
MSFESYPFSEIQKGIYFDCSVKDDPSYNVSVSIEISEVVLPRLENALTLLAAEQPVLRMHIETDGKAKPYFALDETIGVKVDSFCGVKPSKLTEMVEKYLEKTFDLDSDLLWRVALMESDEKRQILVIVLHHIICDGISLGIFKDKLFAYYNAISAGECFELKRNDGFLRFVKKENIKLAKGKYEKQRRYWKENLNGVSVPHFLSDGTECGLLGRVRRFSIPENLMDKICDEAKEKEVTVFVYLLACFAALLYKYTGEDDFAFSSPLSHRPDLELEEAIGCFVYMYPLRFSLNSETSFADLLRATSKGLIEAYKNIGCPNNIIARDNGLIPPPGAAGVFDISFVYDVYESEQNTGALSGKLFETDSVPFAGILMAALNKLPGETLLQLQYSPELFSESSVDTMGHRFLRLLETVTADISIRLENISLILDGEKEKLVKEVNRTHFFKYTPTTLMDIFKKKVSEYPKNVAIYAQGITITYEELDRKSNVAARKILTTGMKGEIVGIHMERCTDYIVALFGILKAGKAYTPIDPHYPEARKRFITEDASVDLVITDRNLAWGLPGISVLYADELMDGNGSPLEISYDPEALAYVEYTSGSTGVPKGVMIRHRSVVNTLLDLERRFPLKAGDVYLLKTPFSFDVSGTELYGWFMGSGGALCVLRKNGEKDPYEIAKTIAEYNVTHVNFVPSMLGLFAEAADKGGWVEKLASLKWVFTGGESISEDTVKRYYAMPVAASLENVYGPTECSIWASHCTLKPGQKITIGRPLNLTRWYVVGKDGKLCPEGIPGELCLSSEGLAVGYLNRPELNAEVFVDNPFYNPAEDLPCFKKMYRTGDLCRLLLDGTAEFLGRIDFQIKIGGIRLELGEIENVLSSLPGVIQSAVVLKPDKEMLCAFYTSDDELDVKELRDGLSKLMPVYMVPSYYKKLYEFPKTSSGKLDRKKLSEYAAFEGKAPQRRTDTSMTELESRIAAVWKDVLSVDYIAPNAGFFESGGNSLGMISLSNKLKAELGMDFPVAKLFQYPSVAEMARFVSGDSDARIRDRAEYFKSKRNIGRDDIAIIGASVMLPEIENIGQFWNVLKKGLETIHFYSDEELSALGISEELMKNPNYIKAKGRVGGIEDFDPVFFDCSPGEIKMTSPQLRLLYKGLYNAFEDASCFPNKVNGRTGVFLGGSDDFEWYRNTIFGDLAYSDKYQAFTMSTNHFLATRLAYKYDIKGPVLSALTGCSTTLVTVHLACQSLLMGECDMAAAGGVTVELPNEGGYLYEDGMMFSPDGHCRPFDDKAAGTVFSNGMGIVILKRLEDAVRESDNIYAVIKGSAINNDGSQKTAFAAPSINGQKAVITEAYKVAGIDPETVSYIEAHGTGTKLGDPIEIESLTEAFSTDKTGFCALGSVKGNVGHTDTAAGVVGLIKVALSLKNKYIPATVNYKIPNSRINFLKTPFVVSDEGRKWIVHEGMPRRAGINSFGVGGTNAHAVLEEYVGVPSEAGRGLGLLAFSAKTVTALDETAKSVINYLAENPEVNPADAAYTLWAGRMEYKYRKTIWIGEDFAKDPSAYISKIETSPVAETMDHGNVYFMFSGQGSQYQGMSRGLLESGSKFGFKYAEYVRTVLKYLGGKSDEYYNVIFGNSDSEKINLTLYTQIALFAVEYAFAKTLIDFGVVPKAMIGHSIGELSAAAVAGVWELPDAVNIVMERGKLMWRQPPGVMLAVASDAGGISTLLPEGTHISLRNTTNNCVAGGDAASVASLERILSSRNIKFTKLKTSHAFHTPMMRKAAEEFEEFLKGYNFATPKYPIISNVSGTWLRDEDATSPEYWARHITSPVEFEKGLELFLQQEQGIFIELGPGRSAVSFAKKHLAKKESQKFINMLRHPKENLSDESYCIESFGAIWCAGGKVNWDAFSEQGKSISLPGYVYDKIPFPIKFSPQKIEGTFLSEETWEEEITETEIRAEGDILEIVLAAYKSVFGFESIDGDADFYTLGGDSLVGVSLASALKKLLGIKIDVSAIFDHRSPGALAKYIEKNKFIAESGSVIKKATSAEYYPLSSPQKRMYALFMLDPKSVAYNLPSATVLYGKLDRVKAENALRKLVQRHEILRTFFEIRNGQPVQVIKEDMPSEIKYISAKIKNNDDLDKMIMNFVYPFDLGKGGLFRAGLADCGDGRMVLLFDVHHIIADGTSVEILTRDFSLLYTGEMPKPELQYKDYAVWQNKWMLSANAKKEKEYWLKALDGNIPVLNLPSDFSRPKVKDFDGGRLHFLLGTDLSEKTKLLSKANEITLYMALLSVWFVTLARLSGQEDIIVGTPTAGRGLGELSEMAGMFINMLAMRAFPSSDKKFSDFLSEVRENVLSAFANQNYQFSDIVDALNLERELNRNALFDVCFDFQNMKLYNLDIEGIKTEAYDFDLKTSAYDLVMTLRQGEDGLIDGFLDYAASLYSETTAVKLTEHFAEVLTAVCDNPDVPIGKISLLTPHEKLWFDNNVNNTDAIFDESESIQKLFEKEVESHPERIALVISDGRKFSYREINNLANRLANRLVNHGLVREGIAAIITEKDEYLFISMLAVLKAGGAYMPIDPELPTDRIKYMLEQSGAALVLLWGEETGLPLKGHKVLNPAIEISVEENNENLPDISGANRLAYIIFTSGSTGKPKGVMIEHHAVVNFIHDLEHRGLFKYGDDRIISVTTPSFDIFVFESLAPLCIGASVYLANKQESLDPALAGAKIVEHGVTHILSTVSRIKVFAEHPSFSEALGVLKCILSGGENYPLRLLELLRGKSCADIYNMYGPSETTVWSTAKKFGKESLITVGSPIDNTKVYIMDSNGAVLPAGVFGELCISGKGLARGYIGNAEETAKRFVYVDSVKVYRTGDKARILYDGEIEISGRIDRQVKIRGYRVEIREIEKAAEKHEAVKQAAVKIWENQNGDNQAVLYYTCYHSLPEQMLKTFLKGQLPEYMIPAKFMRIDIFPTLVSGKPDFNSLPEPKSVTDTGEVNRPKSGLHREVLAIWKEILENDDIGIKDNFFDVGGNSLSLILVNNKLNALLGRSIPLMQLFENPTIESLAVSLGETDNYEVKEDSARQSAEIKDIAVIGISCKFPGAGNVAEFWENILAGRESVIDISDSELENAGITEELYSYDDYVKRKALMEGTEFFDGDFFGYSNKESDMMDPQMRVLHQCVYGALDDGGYDPFGYKGKIGLFAGSSSNVMWMSKFIGRQNDGLSAFETITFNEKDFLATKISYKLNLRGPSVNVQTACSTSLIAIHHAVESIRRGESDMALAGGVGLSFPQKEGYLWQEGMIFSKDGHCRPFSENSTGTVAGNGCGIVLLKSYEQAVIDGDNIYAVIKGSAINNDGSDKVGYTAPSVSSQADAVRNALLQSGIPAESVFYVEAHGTGTELGDPIEVSALKRAFASDKKNYCALGSVKANIGHLDAAAGVAGFIKATLVVKNRIIPPLVNFTAPNPRIDFENSPFYLPVESHKAFGGIAAGVSSFGVGGTNAHIVLTKDEAISGTENAEAPALLVFSAKTKSALENTAQSVIAYLTENKSVSIASAAKTLAGRAKFSFRLTVAAESRKDLANAVLTYSSMENKNSVAFVFGREVPAAKIESALPFVREYRTHTEHLLGTLKDEEAYKVRTLLKEGAVAGSDKYSRLAGFISVLSLAKLLQKAGVPLDFVKGFGVGNVAALVARGAVAAENAIAMIRSGSDIEKAMEEQKPDNYVSGDKFPDTTFVIGIGVGGSEALGCDACVSIDSPKDILSVLGNLWMHGFDINFEYLQSENATRVSLPTYVFDKVYHHADISIDALSANLSASNNLPQKSAVKFDKNMVFAIIKEIFSEAFGSNVSESDSFFDLGGESLSALLICDKVRQRLGVKLGVENILDAPSVAELSDTVFGLTRSVEEANITPATYRPSYELSPAQKRMYAVNEFLSGSTAYNLASAYMIEGNLNKKRLTDVFERIAERHDAFRTCFKFENGEVVQIVGEQAEQIVEVKQISEKEISREMENFLRPFDLSKAPLARVLLLEISEERYVLAVDMHHIITDQTSIGILMKEFAALYAGEKLSEPVIQYKDFSIWQNRRLSDGTIASQIEFWKNEFADGIPVMELDTDYPRPAVQSYDGGRTEYELDKGISEGIIHLAKENGATPYMIFLAALNIMLWKYSRQDEVVVGTGFAGRIRDELQSVVGMFVNTLPLLFRLDRNLTVAEYLTALKKKMAVVYDNQECQFEMLMDVLDVRKDLSRNPLFDVMFNYVNMGTEDFSIEGLMLTPYTFGETDTKYDLNFTVEEENGNFWLSLEYAAKLFKRETADAMLKRLVHVVNEVICFDGCIGEISLSTEREKLLLESFRRGHTSRHKGKVSIIDLFRETVRLYPENTAIRFKGKNLSYSELDKASDRLANKLAEKAGKGAYIALLLDRGIEQITAIIAVLKLGAAYVPIDPNFPASRIEYMLRDSGAAAVIAEKKYADMTFETEFVSADGNGYSEEFIQPEISPDDICYIIYTSGSTGDPKGVMIRHRNVPRVVNDAGYIEIYPDDVIMQLSNYAFDGSVFDIFGALLNGACLTIAPKETIIEVAELTEFIKNESISVFFVTASLFNMLVDWDIDSLKNVRHIVFGGEAASARHVRQAFEALGAGKLINGYGPTETTVFAVCGVINELPAGDTVTIGKPVADTCIYVLDKEGALLPPGVSGELYIGGDGVAAGYLNNDILTDERFLLLPFEGGKRVYRTGDKVKMLPDGTLDYIGRTDFQIKLRGFRIELGEIEQKIRDIEGIKNAVVLAKSDSAGDLYISAYYLSDDSCLTESEVRRELKKSVPDYMIPAWITKLHDLPLNSSGKADRKVLMAMDDGEPVSERKVAPKASDGAALVLEAMRSALARQDLQMDDNFFDFGGQSIKAIAVAKYLRERGIEVRINDIFTNPTAEGLGSLPIFGAMGGTDIETATSVDKPKTVLTNAQINALVSALAAKTTVMPRLLAMLPIKKRFPVSPVQKAQSVLPSVPSGFIGVVENAAIGESTACFAEIIKEHQLLHCSREGGEWLEYNTDGCEGLISDAVAYADISRYSAENAEDIVRGLCEKLFSKYFCDEFPHRLCCLKTGENNFKYIWGFDHSAFDGISAEILRGSVEAKLLAQPEKIEYQAYDTYAPTILEGLEISESEIMREFSLKNWAKLNDEFLAAVAEISRISETDKDEYMLEVPLKDVGADIWRYAFTMAAELLQHYANIDLIPIMLVDYGREYRGKKFYGCVGEFLDLIPMFAGEHENAETFAALCKNEGINFLSMLYDENLRGALPRVCKQLSSALVDFENVPHALFYNFQGYIKREEKQSFAPAEDDLPIAAGMINVNWDDENLYIEVFLHCGINIKRMNAAEKTIRGTCLYESDR